VILELQRKRIPPDIAVLEMSGRIVMGNNSRDVELALGELLREQARKIILDLQGVTMVDSTGVGILVVCQGRIAKEGGQLRVAGAKGIVDEVLRMASVHKLVPFFPSVAEAAKEF
jgi:anti-sigma B factor antagonist